MKEGTTITKLIMAIMAVCIGIYFGIYVIQGMTTPMTTAVAYAYTVNDSVEVDALLVRQEQVMPAGVGIADVLLGEGERVGAGQTVAEIYRDGQALEREAQIQRLTMEAELLQYATTQTEPGSGAAQLEDDVIRAAVELRFSCAGGEFDRLEDQVLNLKRAVLKRDYTYGQGVDTNRLPRLNEEIRALKKRSGQDVSRVYATTEGTFSAQVDGYETVLDPKVAAQLTPAGLDAFMERGIQPDETALGKLITGTRWYLAANVEEETAQRFAPDEEATVRFTGDFSGDVPMRVESVSQAENGRCVLLLSSDRSLAQTTLLRRQTVEIIFNSRQGLRVPKDAVHILTKTVTDEKTGEETKTSTTGVYVLVNGQAEFKAVQTMAEGSGFYVVQSLADGKRTLRPGNQVIVRARDLYDGKVMQE